MMSAEPSSNVTHERDDEPTPKEAVCRVVTPWRLVGGKDQLGERHEFEAGGYLYSACSTSPPVIALKIDVLARCARWASLDRYS
jgi:hypothetical protein